MGYDKSTVKLHAQLLRKYIKEQIALRYTKNMRGRPNLTRFNSNLLFPWEYVTFNVWDYVGNYRRSTRIFDVTMKILGKAPNFSYKFEFKVYTGKHQTETEVFVKDIIKEFDFITSANSKTKYDREPVHI